MHTSHTDTAYFKKRIELKMKHTYLHEFIDAPTIDEEKLFILISIMNRASVPPKQKERYIITTMLVQLALDTHDLVPLESTHDDYHAASEIPKQLTVLAGDYYSGLYYFLLSEIDDFAMIQTLASAIKKINEYKMNLYYRDIKNANEFLHMVKKMETLLFSYVSDYLGLPPLEKTVEEWLLINKLTLEQKKFQSNTTSVLLEAWQNQYAPHDKICFQRMLQKMIDNETNHLKEAVTTHGLQHSPSTMRDLVDAYKILDVEEG
ncbi:MAG TPA: heptaprenyl diphosphate synthase component 1 [Bacillota bacterium]|nr:heptaprenyl diphosphate synthase component 1 [Bacillota bacterium]